MCHDIFMKNSFPTLDQIKNIVRAEGKTIIASFDSDIKRLESRINGVDEKVDSLRLEMNKRFDDNDDAHQEIIGAIDEMADRKIKQHCLKFHSVVS